LVFAFVFVFGVAFGLVFTLGGDAVAPMRTGRAAGMPAVPA
jgi:hypothetical protein